MYLRRPVPEHLTVDVLLAAVSSQAINQTDEGGSNLLYCWG